MYLYGTWRAGQDFWLITIFVTRKEDCSKVTALLGVCQMLLGEMKKEEGPFSKLRPQFYLIGSVAEGTRVGKANEVDITLRFQALHDSPLKVVDSNGCKLRFQKDNALRQFCKANECTTFCHASFMNELLNEISKALMSIKTLPKWPKELTFESSFQPCLTCTEVSLTEGCLKHCRSCRPAVTYTKLGPCLLFKWKEDTEWPLTIDLIPVFPVQSPGCGLLSLFSVAVKTLYRRKPTNWVKHMRAFVERDRMLPEIFLISQDEGEHSNIFDVAVKLLNYDLKDNHIIRPGQVLDIGELRTNAKLKKVYTCLKAVKDLLGISTRSFTIKKVMLLEEVKETLRNPEMLLDEAMFFVVSRPELSDEFGRKVDLKEWGRKIYKRRKDKRLILGHIPLC